ncbi:MAG: hypothetical protein QGI52_02395, partial [Alphaproteobacteria bacterium]|nr:hypothetical protein [Alphaproteobacteria bacterium]
NHDSRLKFLNSYCGVQSWMAVAYKIGFDRLYMLSPVTGRSMSRRVKNLAAALGSKWVDAFSKNNAITR